MASDLADIAQEARAIADEILRLVTRRMAEGADPATIVAGLATAVTLMRGAGPSGAEIAEAVARILTEGVVDGR